MSETPTASSSAPDAAVRSGLHTAGGSLVTRFLLLARSILVARMLVPDEVGRFALAATALGVLDQVTSPGLLQAIVQRPTVSMKQLQAAWTLLVGRGMALALVLALASPLLADALRAPDIAALIAVIAITPAIRGFAGLGPWMRVRNIDLGGVVRVELLGAATDVVVSIVAVAILRNAWGLVIGLVAGTVVEVVASYGVAGFRPALRRPGAETRELVRFGRWVFISNVFGYLSTNGDDLIVGRATGTADLAQYRVAYRLANAPTTEVSHVFGRVAFPVFARSTDHDRGHLEARFTAALTLTAGIAAVAAALLCAVAPDLVTGLLGERWELAVTPLRLMALAGFVRAILATGGPLFQGAGRPHLDAVLQLVRAVVLLVGVVLLVHSHGINGAAVASLVSVLAVVPIWAFGLEVVGLRATRSLLVGLARVPAAVLAGGVAWLVCAWIPGTLLAAIGGGAAGALGWLATTWLLDGPMRRQLRQFTNRLRALRPTTVAP